MSPPVTDLKVIGYVRVSTDDQAESGAGLEAQRVTIEAECRRRGWELVNVVSDEGVSGSVPFAERPGGGVVMEVLRTRQAAGLVVAKLDRLSRSVGDAGGLLELFERRRWALVLPDLGVDTSTPMGEAMANVAATFARLERRLIGLRTKEGLAAKRAAGVRLGRPPEIEPEIEDRILAMRQEGLTLRSIVTALNACHVPTARGGRWCLSTIVAVVKRHEGEVPRFRPGPRHRRHGAGIAARLLSDLEDRYGP